MRPRRVPNTVIAMTKSPTMGILVAVALVSVNLGAAADEAKAPPAKPKEETRENQTAIAEGERPRIHPESSRRSAHAAARRLLDSSLEGFREGRTSLERVITAHRMIIELETVGRPVAAESTPGIYAKHHETAALVSALTKARYEAGITDKADVLFAETHRLMIAYWQKKAEAALERLRAGGR